jgi:hypothetical protein
LLTPGPVLRKDGRVEGLKDEEETLGLLTHPSAFIYDPHHSLVKARQDGLKHVLFKTFRVDQLRDALADLPRR